MGTWNSWKHREVIKFLKKNGFEKIRHNKHPIFSNEKVIFPVPFHSGDIPIGTLQEIIKQSGISKKKWKQWKEK